MVSSGADIIEIHFAEMGVYCIHTCMSVVVSESKT